ncbi:serine hydrolase domain-containing protein [Brevundimonas subvibrioides]|uniref:serine hydrolase domain-containing protein n=1 Tax=Brevundimonas subvibrioides TaxID=74313 RepID=UPI0022B3146C|nr:serine hydrolase domain-containing protein [Brevundimonas subvibrioides]
MRLFNWHVEGRRQKLSVNMLNRRHLLAATGSLIVLPAGVARADAAGWDAALDQAFAAGAAPALGGMVVGPQGAIWTGAKGLRRARGTDPATAGDRWHLGSNTKAMTAAVYGRLVDQGQARWDATLSSLLPGVAMDPAWRDVPITAVMGHVAGLSDQTAMGMTWLMTARDDPRTLPDKRRALVEAFLAVPPAGTPGTFAYANGNYVLLGAVIERITGEAWEQVMGSELFQPLGIESGGFGAPTGAQPWGHRARRPVDPAGPGSDNPLAIGPAGTAHMTLADYGRFLSVFLNDAGDWLSAESRARLMRPMGSGQPPYAGGWMVVEGQPWADGPALTHDGSNTMWYVSAWVAPGTQRAFVAVSNDGEAGRAACQALIPGLIRAT